MGDELDPLTTETQPKPIRHRGILIAMAGIVGCRRVLPFPLGRATCERKHQQEHWGAAQ